MKLIITTNYLFSYNQKIFFVKFYFLIVDGHVTAFFWLTQTDRHTDTHTHTDRHTDPYIELRYARLIILYDRP